MSYTLLSSAAKASSSVASPTSITSTYSPATSTGTLLVLCVCATGTNPTITTPANWSVLSYQHNASIASAIFYYPNNPGSITAVAVTVSASGGGAVASCFEFNGMGTIAQKLLSGTANIGTGTAVPDINANVLYQPNGNVLAVLLVARAAASFTSSFDTQAGWSSSQQAATSTNGTPNAQIDFYYTELSALGTNINTSGTLGASVANVEILGLFAGVDTTYPTFTPVGGTQGVLVGQFYQGMIGG